MEKLSADMAGIAGFTAIADSMAAQMAAAGAGTAAAGPVLLGPVFGLIGGDFVAAFAAAHTAHVAAIAELTGTLASMGVAAASNAASYVGTDTGTSNALAGTDPGASA